MILAKLFWKLLPWALLGLFIFVLNITNHWPFEKEENVQQTIETTLILEKIEQLGKLELVKYNFKELLEYKRTSDGKIIGNSLLNIYNYNPDLSVVLVATGEAVGCIDLSLIAESDIVSTGDTVFVQLPSPELCYYKLDMGNTKLYSFKKDSWWSRLFSDEEERTQILHMAYQKAEERIREAAVSSGIYQSTNQNARLMLKPLFEQLTGKPVVIITDMPAQTIQTY